MTFVHDTTATTAAAATTTNAMEALDGFLLTVVSKGKSCTGGGDEAGLDVQPAHATSLSWAELLRHAAVWNNSPRSSSPMLVVVAVAPLLAQTGVAYVQHLDTLLQQASPGVRGLPVIQMVDLAAAVVQTWHQAKEQGELAWDERECLHVEALHYLVQDQHAKALSVMLKILQICPGDLLALSMAMDLAQTTGDSRSALRYV